MSFGFYALNFLRYAALLLLGVAVLLTAMKALREISSSSIANPFQM